MCFKRNMLMGEHNELRNRFMHVDFKGQKPTIDFKKTTISVKKTTIGDKKPTIETKKSKD